MTRGNQMRNLHLGDAGLCELAKGLRSNTSLQKLNLVIYSRLLLLLQLRGFLFDDVLFSMTSQMQRRTSVTVVGVCRLIACILHNFNLTTVLLKQRPRDCADNDAWKREGLPALPQSLGIYNSTESWTEVLNYLRENAFAVRYPTPWLRATATTFPTHDRVARLTHRSTFLSTTASQCHHAVFGRSSVPHALRSSALSCV
jgi:hypothetical protein